MHARRYSQIVAAVVANPYFIYFGSRKIYGGAGKGVCVPGMNCYACPLALFSCPIGALQHSLATRSAAAILYVVGTLGAIGALIGRIPCGWICPFGFLQDIAYKVPLPKLRIPRWAGYLKYATLGILAVLLPLIVQVHWFSRLCPVGALEGAVPLQILPPTGMTGVTRDTLATGVFFWIKIAILAFFLLWMMVSKRPFCRTACPLGAIWSLFNPFSLYRMQVDGNICKQCNKCQKVCPVDIKVYENPNSPECIRCLECKKACPTGCVASGFTAPGPTGQRAKVEMPLDELEV